MDIEHPFPPERLSGVSTSAPIHVTGIENASVLAKKHKNFDVPASGRLQKIRPGDHVRVMRNGERFWLTVSGFEGKKIIGSAQGGLVRNKDIPFGTNIYFLKKNIVAIHPK